MVHKFPKEVRQAYYNHMDYQDHQQVYLHVLINKNHREILQAYNPSTMNPTNEDLKHNLFLNTSNHQQDLLDSLHEYPNHLHQAIVDLIDGKVVDMHSEYMRETDDGSLVPEQLTLEEYEALMAFGAWFEATQPKVLDREFVLFNEEPQYAGTGDLLAEIKGERYLIDFKTGQDIWPEHELQVSAYANAIADMTMTTTDVDEKEKVITVETDVQKPKTAILQVGYRRNKRGWKFTEIADKYDLFLASYRIWQEENGNVKPFVKDYPVSLKLGEVKDETH